MSDEQYPDECLQGLGVMKAPYISYSQPPEAVEIMKKLKQSFDPKGIMVCLWLSPTLFKG